VGYALRVAEHLVLQSSPFKTLKNHSFEHSLRVENSLLALYQLERSGRAFQSAYPTADASGLIYLRISFGKHMYCVDRTHFRACAAVCAEAFIRLSDET